MTYAELALLADQESRLRAEDTGMLAASMVQAVNIGSHGKDRDIRQFIDRVTDFGEADSAGGESIEDKFEGGW